MALVDLNSIPDVLEQRFRLHVYLVVSTVGGVVVAYLMGWRWLFPLLSGVLVYPVFFMCIVAGESRLALGTMLLWSLLMSLSVIAATVVFPERSERLILTGQSYVQQEMIPWIETGAGKESDLHRFLPDHALHFSVFIILTLVSAGFFSLIMGAYLLNYMNYYVGWLIGRAAHPWLALAFGWSPWSIMRVIGYICVAIALSDIPLSKLFGRQNDRKILRTYLLSGCSLVVLDIICKWLLAPVWASLLRRAIG